MSKKYCIVCGTENFSRSKSYCCRKCHDKDYNSKYYKNNQEKLKQTHNEWNNKNKQYFKDYYIKNKEEKENG